MSAQRHMAGTPASTPGPRKLGSKKQRPCDYCRIKKHSCHIETPGQPCSDCRARNRECTFVKPAVKRKVPTTLEIRGPSLYDYLREVRNAGRKQLIRDDVDDDSDDAYYDSIDLEHDDHEESHFLDSNTVTDSIREALSSKSDRRHIGMNFRNVSYDDDHPVIFVKNPALLYGRAQEETRTDDVHTSLTAQLGEAESQTLIDMFKTRTLTAFPIANRFRFEASIRREPGSGDFPAALLCCAIAHSAYMYAPESIGTSHLAIWKRVLLTIEDEYRSPRLQTLQTALTLILCTPHVNHGQHAIGIARVSRIARLGRPLLILEQAVGCAQLLGLHIDSDGWKLPRWEKSVRKRLWWTLLISDKWRSFVYGRPSIINSEECSVALPKLRHSDWGVDVHSDDEDAMLAFIAMCTLTVILQRIITHFYSVKSSINPLPSDERLAVLSSISEEVDEFAQGLPDFLSLPITEESSSVSGVRSMQASYLGIQIAVIRLAWNTPKLPEAQLSVIFRAGMEIAQSCVQFLETLKQEDYELYWLPYTWHHICSAAGLLIRAIRQSDHPSGSTRAQELLVRLVKNIRHAHELHWMVAVTVRIHLREQFLALVETWDGAEALLLLCVEDGVS
ncbi:hypothetical protein P7C73_g1135, partial [Tremellales sp. Uapishka_1]